MKETKTIDTGVVLILFCVFIISTFTVLVLGVGAYQNIAAISGRGYDERVTLSYIWTKVKSGEEADMVHVGDFHGQLALFIDEVHNGSLYRTAVYHHDGWIYELFFLAGHDYLPRDGNPVAHSETFLIEQRPGGLIWISVGGEGMWLYPRTG